MGRENPGRGEGEDRGTEGGGNGGYESRRGERTPELGGAGVDLDREGHLCALDQGLYREAMGAEVHGASRLYHQASARSLRVHNNYFNDTYQGIPVGGYNKLIEGLLEGVETRMNVDFFADRTYCESLADKIVFTGKIDEFYGYCFGKLEYRTVRFEEEIHECCNYQGNAVVNYTERDIPYTRIIEHKHFEMFGNAVNACPKTVISKEYSTEWKEGMEPYYPVNDERNMLLAEKYRQLAETEKNVIFGGRLAEYKYYDMGPVVEKVFRIINSN